MLVDRCPTCQGPMVFHAITTGKNGWRRWVECYECKKYVSNTVDGTRDVVISTPPPKSILARNEDYSDEADSSYGV